MKRSPLLYPLVILMVVFWSGNYIAGKWALREFPSLLLAALRIMVAGVAMLPVYWWQTRRAGVRAKWQPGDHWLLFALGVLGVTFNQVLFVLGLSRTSVAHSSFIIGLVPVMVLLTAALKGMERITARKAAGMLVALTGIVILKTFEHRGGGGPTWTGDLLTLGCGIAFALFTVYGKPVTLRHSSVTVNTYGYVGGALCMAPIAAWQLRGFPLARVSAAAWLSLLYMAMFSSVLCYLIYYWALSHIAASRVSAFSYLQPVLATAMGVVLLDEPLTASVVAGGATILAGVYLAERG